MNAFPRAHNDILQTKPDNDIPPIIIRPNQVCYSRNGQALPSSILQALQEVHSDDLSGFICQNDGRSGLLKSGLEREKSPILVLFKIDVSISGSRFIPTRMTGTEILSAIDAA